MWWWRRSRACAKAAWWRSTRFISTICRSSITTSCCGASGRSVAWAAKVLLGGQHAQAGARSFAHFRRIGAEETRGVHHAAVDDGVVLAEVMALDAIAPGAGIAGRAKDGEVVFLGIAPFAGILLHDAQHVFEAHDGHRST